jgi:hypothetical protein
LRQRPRNWLDPKAIENIRDVMGLANRAHSAGAG